MRSKKKVVYPWRKEFHEKFQRDFFQGSKPCRFLGMPEESLALFQGQAEELLRAGSYREAAEIFRELASLETKKPDIYSGLGDAEFAMGNFQEAFKAYVFLRECDPGNFDSYTRLITCAWSLGEDKFAEDLLNHLLELAEEDKEIEALLKEFFSKYESL